MPRFISPFQPGVTVQRLRAIAQADGAADRVEHGEIFASDVGVATAVCLQRCTNNNPSAGGNYRRDLLPKQNHGIRMGGLDVQYAGAGAFLAKRNGTSGLDQRGTTSGFVQQNRDQWIATTYDENAAGSDQWLFYTALLGHPLAAWAGGWSETLNTRVGHEDISGEPLIIGNRHTPTYDRSWPGKIYLAMVWDGVALTLPELLLQQAYPWRPIVRRAECVLFSWYGDLLPDGRVRDRSGQGNHGTVINGGVANAPQFRDRGGRIVGADLNVADPVPSAAFSYAAPMGF